MEVEKIMGNTDKYEKCYAQRKQTKRKKDNWALIRVF